jgi:uncharacterized protein (TIGR02246 family)
MRLTGTALSRLCVATLIGLVGYTPCHGQVVGSPEDEQAIRKVIGETTEAFNRHDATALVRLYTPDADLVTLRGEWMRGVAEIERGMTAIFATRNKHSTLKTLDVRIRFIRPDVALAHVTNELSGVLGAEGQSLPAHRELSIRVFARGHGVWRVSAFHNTLLSGSATPAPTR